ncbi:flagellar biosynthesis anti-sigma factor FlgM [Campylobacter jejuni]|nr:flagellar biosynthesis anti-sigma factor FlgM [Campylobacter jejuni]
MINPIQQSYVANTTLNTNRIDKETKTNDTQKTENDKASKIAEQIKAAAIADSLI